MADSPTATTVPRVYAAIRAITKAMSRDGISKDRRNTQQNYAFRGIDDVLNALSALYAEHGIFVLPAYGNRTVSERETKQGGALFNVTLEGTYRIKSAEDGSEEVSGPFIGEAMDSADKATNKAMSAAYKYFAIQTFSIPTEGDNDADASHHDVAAKPRVQPPAPAPDGYDDWVHDLGAVADEGEAALRAAWEKSKPEFRKRLSTVDGHHWAAMKAKAAKVKVAAA